MILNTICPALVLATKRTANVAGRTLILTPSTQDKKIANQLGTPAGRIPPTNFAGL